MGNLKNFDTNFHSESLRKNFKSITGIDANDNPAAFIAFLNNIIFDDYASWVERKYQEYLKQQEQKK